MTSERDPLALFKYKSMMLPVLRSVEILGGSGRKQEILEQAIEEIGITDDEMSLTYENRNKSILLDRLEWALSYCKLSGALESPSRAFYMVTALGRDILASPEDEARNRLFEMDAEVRSRRSRDRKRKKDIDNSDSLENDDGLPVDEESLWQEAFLVRLHKLTADQFEEYSLALLRSYGLTLERTGQTGDEGIDGIGLAPMGELMSSTVAVQCKRNDPSGKPIGRSTVALFQRDAMAKGAERAIFITLSRFTFSLTALANEAVV